MEETPKNDKLKHVYPSPYFDQSSPSEFKETKHRPSLSASLKARLKRTRRSFVSPLSVAKRLCVDNEEDDGSREASADCHETVAPDSVDATKNQVKTGSDRLFGALPAPKPQSSAELAEHLRKEVKDKTETLRRLRMVKMYRNKNDLTQLQTLIDKWRGCAQAALYELQSDVPIDGRKADLSEIIDLFGLDDSILHFDRTEEDFTT